jgi:hypothetical protein
LSLNLEVGEKNKTPSVKKGRVGGEKGRKSELFWGGFIEN